MQPKWKFIANLGDVNPLDHGGYFVFEDESGVYPPEAELLEAPEDDGGEYVVYRFALEPCTFIDGVLSDNRFHPDFPAWFAKPEAQRADRPQDTTYLSNVARCSGTTLEELVALFTSTDPCKRAIAWREIGMYHGFENLDSYPLKLSRAEAKARIELARKAPASS